MVPVYDENDEIIGEVAYNGNLDFWDGRNWTCGSTGRHKGLAQLGDGRFVLIHGTQWQGERDRAEIITPYMAVQEVLRSGDDALFKLYPELEEERQKHILRENRVTEKTLAG